MVPERMELDLRANAQYVCELRGKEVLMGRMTGVPCEALTMGLIDELTKEFASLGIGILGSGWAIDRVTTTRGAGVVALSSY